MNTNQLVARNTFADSNPVGGSNWRPDAFDTLSALIRDARGAGIRLHGEATIRRSTLFSISRANSIPAGRVSAYGGINPRNHFIPHLLR
jgi:hypothetical protein